MKNWSKISSIAAVVAISASVIPTIPVMADEPSAAATAADSVLYRATFDGDPCVGEDVVKTSAGNIVKVNECFPAYEVGVTGTLPHHHSGEKGNSDDKTSKWILPGDTESYPYTNNGAGTSNTYQLVDNVFGKTDKALKMTPASTSNAIEYLIPANAGGINDISGGWFGNGGSPYRGALANATADLEDGQQLKISFDIARSEIQGNLAVRLESANGMLMQNCANGSDAISLRNDGSIQFMGRDTGVKYESGKWYNIAIVLTKGSKTASLYIDDEAVAPNGYLSSQMAQAALKENFAQLFRVTISQGTNQTSDVYLDNLEITAVAEGTAINPMDNNVETFDMFNGYSSSVPRYKYMDFLNMNNGNGYSANKVSGKFGKAADDVSMKLAIEPLGTNQTNVPQIKMYQYEYLKNWQYGDKIRMGIRFAYDSDLFYNTLVLHLRDVNAGGNSTLMDFMKVMDGKLNFMGTDYRVNWTPNNWYNLEWVIEPGNGTDIKNKITAYVDGEEIASNEFDANKNTPYSAMAGISECRITLDNALNGWNQQADQVKSGTRAGFNLYLDDYTVCRTANNSVTPVTVSADGITTDYKSTLFIKNNETVAQMKAKVSVSGGTAEYVAADGTALSDDASAAGGYLKVTASSGTVYYYSIVNNIMWHAENFESYDVIANTKYQGTVLDKKPNSSITGKKNLAGKSGQAYGFDYSAEDGTAGDASGLDFNRTTAIPVEDTTVVEFSMYANANVEKGLMTGGGAQYYYEYINDSGEKVTETDGIRNLITMERGYIYAGESITGNELCKAENGRWYKIALVMNPNTYTMDIYVNGELKKSNVTLDKIDYVVNDNDELQAVDRTMEKTGGKQPVLTGILRFKVGGVLRATTGANSGTYAYDDVKIYAGSYSAAEDMADITVNGYDASTAGIIKIDTNEDCSLDTFMKNIVLNVGVKSATLYDDDTFSGSDAIKEDGVSDGNILAVETQSGTMHYYVIKDIAGEDSAELKLFLGNMEIQPGTSSFAAGKYTLKAVINKTDDTSEDYLAILALKKDGKLVNVRIAPQIVTNEGETVIPVEMDVNDAEGITFEAYLWDAFDGMNIKADARTWEQQNKK